MRYFYVALVLSLAAPVFLHAAEVVLMEEIAAKVNGDIITNTELRDDRKGVEEELTKQGLSGAQYEQALNQMVADLLRNRIDEILLRQKGKDLSLKVEAEVNKQIADYEQLKMLVVAKDAWSIENGCLTPTMKIKRANLEKAIEPKLDAWYAANPPVQWA